MVKCMGINKQRNDVEQKKILEWYKGKESPKSEWWFDGRLGGDLLFHARNYTWSTSHSKECKMCDMRVDETVEHEVLECKRYKRDGMEMMCIFLTEM